MISNFNEVEKSLKRCLKEKVSITTTTVVGFLIAGTVAFGGLIPDLPTGNEVITIDQPNIYYITKSGNDADGKEIVINGKNTGKGGPTSNVFSAQSDVILTNKAAIWVTDDGVKGYAQAMGASNASGTVINEGIIYVDGTDIGFSAAEDRIKGIGIDAGEAYNRGTIIVNDGSAMTDNSGSSKKTMINDTDGTITVEGKGVGLYYRMEANKGLVENKGTINVTGAGIGVLVTNGLENKEDQEKSNGKIFTNSGKIIANNGGTAIKASGTKNTTIKLTAGSHIEGLIYLLGTNNTVDIDGVGTDDTPEENNIKSNDVNVVIDNSNIILKGTLNSKTKGTTVVVNNENGKTTLVNNAAISSNNSSNNIGMHLDGTKENKIEVTNTKDGSITVSGDNAIGVKVDGASTTFINDGVITLKEGTINGVGISVNKGTATNNGTIALELGKNEDSATNNIAIANTDGTAKNTGKIKITDKTSEELKDFDISTLFTGNYINSGMIVGKDGIAIEQEGDTVIADNTNTNIINNAGKEGSSIVIKDGVTITASEDSIKVESLNVTGKVTIANGEESKPVVMEGTKTNLDANGSLAIGSEGKEAGLTITNGTVNAEAGKTAVTFEHADSSLALSGTDFYGNIGNDANKGTLQTTGTEKATVITGDVKANKLELAGTTAITGNIETKTMNVTAGETRIDGTITGAETITIGNVQNYTLFALKSTEAPTTVEKNATVTYSADSKIIGKGAVSGEQATHDNGSNNEKTIVTIGDNGVVKAEVGNEGNYVFSNSENVDVKGNGTVELLTSNLNKQTLKLKEGTNVAIEKNLKFITNSNFYSYDGENLVYILDNAKNERLNDIYNKAYIVNDVLSQNDDEREAQLDYIYSNNVYSETVKMAMDTLRMNEDAVLSLGGKPEEGKWTAQGKMLFSRTEYDRTGVIRDFGVETKTAGLLGALEYGVSEKSSIGFAFSGTKQDLDMKKASADGDAFYFGVYGKQDVNNFKLTAGLGYQLDKIDADNNVMVSTGDKYDSKAFSGYAQGKYVINAGNDVTVEPKLKLALTRLTQESAKDKHFEMEKVEATTFDTEVGVDLVKTVKLESGKMNLLAGISYTRSMGDTDNKFKGNFVGTDGTKGERFDVLGANLGENTLKINIGAEVEKDNGFFYNGGLNYKFDNEDRETFGATIGAGYKF